MSFPNYRIVPRTEIGLPAVVTSASGARRQPLRNERWVVAHYTGVNTVYSGRDVPAQVRHIQAIFSATKPFEYNYVIGQTEDDAIYEFAGKFQAAHSGGENADSFGVLFLNGVNEPPTATQIDKWRWLRDVLIFDGSLRPIPDQRRHEQMPGAATACAGAHVRAAWGEFLKPWTPPVAPTLPSQHTQPPVQLDPTINDEDFMKPSQIIHDTKLGGVFACIAGRWVPWFGGAIDGVPYFSLDHEHVRAQILYDQGPEGRDIWLS